MEGLIVTQAEEGLRLDSFLATRFEKFSRTYFQDLIEKGLVLVNGARQKKRYLVIEDDEIEVEFASADEPELQPEPIAFDILYEDEHLLAINKPAGMVVHPAVGNWRHTFVHGLLYHCKQLQQQQGVRPGIVHRLDKETSGVLIAAKTLQMQQKMVEIFAERKIQKTYLAICHGNPGNRLINNHIGRHPHKRQQMAVVQKGGKSAQTRIQLLHVQDHLSSVALFPKTGRTHQLRVHLQSLGCPILGDNLYGLAAVNARYSVHRQLLHAYRLVFHHPNTNELMQLTAPLPADMYAYFDPKSLVSVRESE